MNAFAGRLGELHKALNVDGAKVEIGRLEERMSAQNFWDDPEAAQKVVQKLKGLKTVVDGPEYLQREIDDAQELVELAGMEADASMGSDLTDLVTGVEAKLDKLEITSLFQDPRDSRPEVGTSPAPRLGCSPWQTRGNRTPDSTSFHDSRASLRCSRLWKCCQC